MSFEIQLHPNWSVSLGEQNYGACGWKTWNRETDTTVGLPLRLYLSNGTAQPFENGTGYKPAFSLNSTDSASRPRYEWPPAHCFNVGDPPSYRPIPYFSKVQFALPFFIVVIIANVMKTVAIVLTLWTYSPRHIITVGDAVASFLETSEPRSKGKCLLDKSNFSWSKTSETENL